MPAAEKVMQVAKEWVAKAESDLVNARHSLKLRENCPTDTICFHAGQCVEKYLKALLVTREVPFPKSHEIEVLLALLPSELRPPISVAQQELCTQYAIAARYPGYRAISREEAEEAVALADAVRTRIRAALPAGALQSK